MSQSKGTIVIGGTKSDSHVVSIYIVSLLLQEAGYNVINKSCQNDVEELLSTGELATDIVAFVVVNQNGQALDDLQLLKKAKSELSLKVPIILGGHYWVGCNKMEEYDVSLMKAGVDFLLTEIDELLPLLNSQKFYKRAIEVQSIAA